MFEGLRRTLMAQGLLAAAAAAGFLFWGGAGPALAAVYGGGIVLFNTLLLAWRLGRSADLDGNQIMLAMYAGAAQRLIVAGVAFAVGIAVLRLAPIPMIVAFAAAQAGYLAAGSGGTRAVAGGGRER